VATPHQDQRIIFEVQEESQEVEVVEVVVVAQVEKEMKKKKNILKRLLKLKGFQNHIFINKRFVC
jgi:hypothetical protein